MEASRVCSLPKKKVCVMPQTSVTVPQSLEEATALLGEIGIAERDFAELQRAMNEAVERVKSNFLVNIAVIEEKITAQKSALTSFANSHRRELTNNEKRKTVAVVTGDFGWKKNPEAVEIKDQKAATTFCATNSRFEIFVDRSPVLADKKIFKENRELAKEVPGVAFVQEEKFFINPSKVNSSVGEVKI